jgi:hypothetical protein
MCVIELTETNRRNFSQCAALSRPIKRQKSVHELYKLNKKYQSLPIKMIKAMAFYFFACSVCLASDFKFVGMTLGKSPSGAWQTDELRQNNKPAKVFEYRLSKGPDTYIVSQVWNDECTSRTCPTKLLLRNKMGNISVLLNEEMQQIISPNDLRFKGDKNLDKSFVEAPFSLSQDNKTLRAGPESFDFKE